jgi:hypothetical protein
MRDGKLFGVSFSVDGGSLGLAGGGEFDALFKALFHCTTAITFRAIKMAAKMPNQNSILPILKLLRHQTHATRFKTTSSTKRLPT